MRQGLLRGALVGLLIAPVAAGCVLPPDGGVSTPPEGQVVVADARALAYGRSAGEILANPELRDKIRGLLMIRGGGEQLMARLDEGGFSHHYAYGPGTVGGPAGAGPVLGSALRALQGVSDGSPYPRPAP